MGTLETLEKRTQAWPQAERESLGRDFGIGYTAVRFQGSGSMEGLEFLYPFLNDSDVFVRAHALQAAGMIFSGAGQDSLEKLSYITENRDLAIRDRSCWVVGRALEGEDPRVFLDTLRPSYSHRSNFIRALAARALGLAGARGARPALLAIFEECMRDKDSLVARNAIAGLGAAFAGTGDRDAVRLLEPVLGAPLAGHEDEGRARGREAGAAWSAAAMALAHIVRNSGQENDAAQSLRENIPSRNGAPAVGREMALRKASGVRALAWMFSGNPRRLEPELQIALPASFAPGWSAPRIGVPRNVANWVIASAFIDSSEEGREFALNLLQAEEHPYRRIGLLGLGLAARKTCDEKALAAIAPFLTHGNGALRDAAHLAIGFVGHRSGSGAIRARIEAVERDDRRGPSVNRPFAVALLFQGTGDENAARSLLASLEAAPRIRRLATHAAQGLGLVYQGTKSPRAVDASLPTLETSGGALFSNACLALQLADFAEAELLNHAWWPWISWPPDYAGGPGADQMFVFEHCLGPRKAALPGICRSFGVGMGAG